MVFEQQQKQKPTFEQILATSVPKKEKGRPLNKKFFCT